MRSSSIQKAIAGSLLLIAVALIVCGMTFKRKIYDQKDEFSDFGLATFSRLNDAKLVVDATFTGVTRTDGKLYSTYNRALPRGKKACPT